MDNRQRANTTPGTNVSPPSSKNECLGLPDAEETRAVEAVVFALIPEYDQVKVRDLGGHIYALTRKTRGVDLLALQLGQRVACTVTRRLPRVLRAKIIG